VGDRTSSTWTGDHPLEGIRLDSHRSSLPELAPVRHAADEGAGHGLAAALDHQFLAACQPAIDEGTKIKMDLAITNVDRTVGTLLGSEISRRHGGAGSSPARSTSLPRLGRPELRAFVPRGVTMRLIGDANDYFGKGLCGGQLIVLPPPASPFAAEEQIIAGNVILYGATAARCSSADRWGALLRAQLGRHRRGRGCR